MNFLQKFELLNKAKNEVRRAQVSQRSALQELEAVIQHKLLQIKEHEPVADADLDDSGLKEFSPKDQLADAYIEDDVYHFEFEYCTRGVVHSYSVKLPREYFEKE